MPQDPASAPADYRIEQLRAAEATWRRVRWCAAAFVAATFAPFTLEVRLPGGVGVGWACAVTVAFIVVLNTVSWAARRRGGAALIRVATPLLAGDLAVALGLVWMFQPSFSPTWAVLAAPILEAALLAGPRGALTIWASASAGYLLALAWEPTLRDQGMRTLVFQLVVLLLIASISGRQAGVVSGQVIRLAAQRADLARRAGSDTLTGLPNRQLLLDRLEHALALARREDSAVAVLFLDCDGFKTVNDTYGHQAGDQVLVEVAHRLESTVRNADSIARIGGDEFVIVLAGRVAAPAVPAIVDGVCQRLVRVLTAPMSVPADTDTAVVVGASIGASWCQGGDCAADLLLAAADGAMYTAKQAGGGTWRAAGRIDTTAAADVFPADRTPPARLAGHPTSVGVRPRGGSASGHSTGSASDT